MKFVSTRGRAPAVTFSQALGQGLAPDGGLYVPEVFPAHRLADFKIERFGGERGLGEFGALFLRPFLGEDPLASGLAGICSSALNFPVPLKLLARETAVLELFHGPTAAFKDVGARFLAECVTRMNRGVAATVIVATSGDTGGAVAGAFFGKPGIEVFILFPKGRISKRQEKQLTCWGGNIRAFSVLGTFDDCQRVVKAALSDAEWRARRAFVSANSISIGRLLPQAVYYAKASLEYVKARGRAPGVIVPTGNLGNAVAALWAKKTGFPIGQVVLATNANRAIEEYFQSGAWRAHATVATLANAMDVGNPSNMERLLHLYPSLEALKADVGTLSVGDDEIRDAIRKGERVWGETWCPHTATAVVARERLGGSDWILAATAHPAKFETIVEPLVGHEVPVPPALMALLDREPACIEIEPELHAFQAAVG